MKNSGFTLLETMIYIALFGILMTGTLITAYALISSVADNQIFEASYTEGLFVQQKLSWELSQAVSAIVHTSQVLEINQTDRTVWFIASSSQWWLRENSEVENVLTSSEFIISNVHIEMATATADVPTKIKITYKIQDIPFLLQRYLQ